MRRPRSIWVSVALVLLFAAGPARATVFGSAGDPGPRRPHRLRAVAVRLVSRPAARAVAQAGPAGSVPSAGPSLFHRGRAGGADRARPATPPDVVPERASRPPPLA